MPVSSRIAKGFAGWLPYIFSAACLAGMVVAAYFVGRAHEAANCSHGRTIAAETVTAKVKGAAADNAELSLDRSSQRQADALSTQEKVDAVRNHTGNDCLNTPIPAGL